MRRDAPRDDSPSWYGIVVCRLIELRAEEGPMFERHWGMAMKLYPPRGGVADVATPRLFDEDGRRPDTVLSFFKRVAQSAYYNERGKPGTGIGPALGYFRAEMVRPLDESAPAKVGRVSRAFRSAA